jgi:hypothetical protein
MDCFYGYFLYGRPNNRRKLFQGSSKGGKSIPIRIPNFSWLSLLERLIESHAQVTHEYFSNMVDKIRASLHVKRCVVPPFPIFKGKTLPGNITEQTLQLFLIRYRHEYFRPSSHACMNGCCNSEEQSSKVAIIASRLGFLSL